MLLNISNVCYLILHGSSYCNVTVCVSDNAKDDNSPITQLGEL